MRRNDGATTKIQRHKEIAKLVHGLIHNSKDDHTPLQRTISLIEVEVGLSRSKAESYLKTLESLGHFELDFEDDKIRKKLV